MRKPNFFIVGAPRCGTTSMYAYLRQHPEIYVSPHKETHFFGSDLSPLPGAVREEELYLELFAGAGDRPRLGEAS
ncbi:MAG TPA: sulfotransferase, partial [Thermoanaerobaculia bacterium]|nr:sulfotransferase [Thermoanaerobaculia bacterium]